MWFKTQHLGTDYIRIAMDVHRDQLFEVTQAVTGAADRAAELPASAQQAHRVATRLTEPHPDAERALVLLLQEGPLRHAVVLTDEDVTIEQAAAGLARLMPFGGVDAEDDAELDCEGPGAEGVDGGEDR